MWTPLIPHCPIRADAIKRSIAGRNISDWEALDYIAALQTTACRIGPELHDALWRVDYPLPPVRGIMIDIPERRDNVIEIYDRWLPKLSARAACATLAHALGSLPRYPFWMHTWDEQWGEWKEYREISNEHRQRIHACRDALQSFSGFVECRETNQEVVFRQAEWDWTCELLFLPVNYTAALAVRTARRWMPVFEYVFPGERTAEAARSLDAAGDFLSGQTNRFLVSPDYCPGDLEASTDSFLASVPIGAAMTVCHALDRYLLLRERDHAEQVRLSAQYASQATDYLRLLGLATKQFPELEGPIDVSDTGPLGKIEIVSVE